MNGETSAVAGFRDPASARAWVTLLAVLFLAVSFTIGHAAEEPNADKTQTDRPSLESWRKVQEACQAAVREPNTPHRITRCEAVLDKYSAHEDLEPVLTALIEAYIETGQYEPGKVARLLERRASLRDDEFFGPMQLVDDYYLKYGLPLDSGRRLLRSARVRLERERGKLDKVVDPKQRKREESHLDFFEARTWILEGLLEIEHGLPKKALQTLGRAENKAQLLPQGVLIQDESGEPVRRMSTGTLDALELGLAAAYARTGRKQQAIAHLDRMLGFFSKQTLNDLHAEVRTELGLTPPGGADIVAEPVPASDFELEDLAGDKQRLSGYRGKVVLVNFFATWCAPCRKELPILQRFADSHAEKGVEILAISTDDYNDREQLGPFLETNNLDFEVLLEDPKQLTAYDYRGIPALYVIDREGRIASARTGYDPELKEKLENTILGIIDGEPTPGRKLLTVERAPNEFGLLWMQPVEGDVDALAIAPPLGDRTGEVAVVGRHGLMRWSADGTHLGNTPLEGWNNDLRSEDLDGDGSREWIVTGWEDVKVLDSNGKSYWTHEPGLRGAQLAAVRDLDGDGTKEMILQGEDEAIALRHVPDNLWRNEELRDLQAVCTDPSGCLLAQADDKVRKIGPDGKMSQWSQDVPAGYTLCSRIDMDEGCWLDVYSGRWDRAPEMNHDVDGDASSDVVIIAREGLVAYDTQGSTVLRIAGRDTEFQTSIGDLDGLPGDEVVLFVKHFGLVALGRGSADEQLAQHALEECVVED